MQYLWFVREVARLLRTRTGRDLAFHLEAVMRKRQSFGCEPSSMQEIVVQIHNALKPAEAVVEGTTKSEDRNPNDEPSPKPETKTAMDAKTAKTCRNERQSAKDEAGGKDEGQRPKDEAVGKLEEPNVRRTSAVGDEVPDEH